MTPSRFMPPRRALASAARLAAVAGVAAIAATGCGSSSSKSKTSASSSATSTAAASSATSTAAASSASGTATGFVSRPFATGVTVTHSTPSGKAPVTQPDDITTIGGHLFVCFQNGVGPQGEPSQPTKGVVDSTIVDFSSSGAHVAQWDLRGHCDGLTADPTTGKVIATVNEDANSSLFVIDPASPTAVQYHYPKLPHNGGTDAIAFYHGMMLISASAPGTSGKAAPQASYPAVYAITLNAGTHKASIRSMFGDEATAKRANVGASGTTKLALVDPDSNEVVPSYAQRFGGDFVLDSQGDQEQIFMPPTGAKSLSVLKLSQSVNDSVWTSGPSGTLYVADNGADLIDKVTGPFHAGSELTAVTPCDSGKAPMSCPGPGFPNNYLGQVDPTTGAVSKVALTGQIPAPGGMLFVP